MSDVTPLMSDQLKNKMDHYGQTHILIAERDGTTDQLVGNALCRVDSNKGGKAVSQLLGNKHSSTIGNIASVRGLNLKEFNELAALDEVYSIEWSREMNLTH